jgi:hypothetical protein
MKVLSCECAVARCRLRAVNPEARERHAPRSIYPSIPGRGAPVVGRRSLKALLSSCAEFGDPASIVLIKVARFPGTHGKALE